MVSRRRSWAGRGLLGVLLSVLAAGTAHAPPPAPPMPGVTEGSCGSVRTAAPFPPVEVKATRLGPETIGVKDGRLGRLSFLWGVRLTSPSPRLKSVTALEISGASGLLAVTAAGDWVRLDPGARDRPPSLSFAAMVLPPGRPIGLTDQGYGDVTVSFEGAGSRFYALGLCGAAARPLDLWDGEAGKTRADDPMPGWRLVDASEADRFVPDLRPGVTDFYSLWRPRDGGASSLLQRAYREAGQATPRVEELARFDRPVGAMTTLYGEGKVLIYVTLENPEAGSLDLYLFLLDV